jgi:hypothetical protein
MNVVYKCGRDLMSIRSVYHLAFALVLTLGMPYIYIWSWSDRNLVSCLTGRGLTSVRSVYHLACALVLPGALRNTVHIYLVVV